MKKGELAKRLVEQGQQPQEEAKEEVLALTLVLS